MIYLLCVTFGLLAVYVALLRYPHVLFHASMKSSSPVFSSLMCIVVLSGVGYGIVEYIPDYELGNRFLHAYGGGFMVTLVALLAVRDGGFPFTRLNTVFFTLVLVTLLGTVNELAEYALTHLIAMEFLTSFEDTWRDLASNTTGAVIGLLTIPYFINRKGGHL